MEATDIQSEARALGDPTRHRLFGYVADAARPGRQHSMSGGGCVFHVAAGGGFEDRSSIQRCGSAREVKPNFR